MSCYRTGDDIAITVTTDLTITGAIDINVRLCRERFNRSSPSLDLDLTGGVIALGANEFQINLIAADSAQLKGIYYLTAVVVDASNKTGSVKLTPNLLEFK